MVCSTWLKKLSKKAWLPAHFHVISGTIETENTLCGLACNIEGFPVIRRDYYATYLLTY